MTEKTLTGGCHCGQVRFECTADLGAVTACNCSICTKKGLHFTFLPPDKFQLRAGEDNLRDYRFHTRAIAHQLCIDCGVELFARRRHRVDRAQCQLHRRYRSLDAHDAADRWAQPLSRGAAANRTQSSSAL